MEPATASNTTLGSFCRYRHHKRNKTEPNNFARASRYSQVTESLLLFHKKKKNKNYFLLVCLFVYRRCLENEKKKFGKNKRYVIKSVRVLVKTIFQSGQDGNKAKMFKLEWVCCKGR